MHVVILKLFIMSEVIIDSLHILFLILGNTIFLYMLHATLYYKLLVVSQSKCSFQAIENPYIRQRKEQETKTT